MIEKYLVVAINGDGSTDLIKWCNTIAEAQKELDNIKKLRESKEWDGEYLICEIIGRYKPNP